MQTFADWGKQMADGSLAPVIVGGLLAMGGGAVTGGITLIVNAIQSSKDKEKRRAEKFEELVTAVYEFEAWLNDRENMMAWGEKVEIGVSPLAKLESISAVYFPTFMKKIEALALVSKNYQAWMAEAGFKRTSGKTAQEVNEGLIDVYNPYLVRRDELLEELKKYAVENFR
jgi:hypothetical protein